jgi:YD repeat-containing protein
VVSVVNPYDTAEKPSIINSYVYTGTPPSRVISMAREKSGGDEFMVSASTVDGLGRTIQNKVEASALGRYVTTDLYYDLAGREAAFSVPYESHFNDGRNAAQKMAGSRFDDLGRPVATINTDGTVQYMVYSQWDAISIDAMQRFRWTHQDAYGRTKKITEFLNNADPSDDVVVDYDYDHTTGELLTIHDPRGNNFMFDYDSMGRKIAQTDKDLGTWSHEYDVNGNVVKETDARGFVTQLNYDALNRLLQKTANDGGKYVYKYDQKLSDHPYDSDGGFVNGRLVSVEGFNDKGESYYRKSFSYDRRGRGALAKIRIDDHEWTTRNEYDALNRVTAQIYPDGERVVHQYDNRGSLVSVVGERNGVSQTYLKNVIVSSYGKPLQVDYGNGTSIHYRYYDNDQAVDRVDGLSLPFSNTKFNYRLRLIAVTGGDVKMAMGYYYDRAGNILHIPDYYDAAKTQSFAYDPLDRLSKAKGVYGLESYAYDKAGNILQKSGRNYTGYTEGNRIGSDGLWDYTHDENGNIVSRIGIGSNAGKTEKFTYDAFNRLANVEQN